MVGIRLFFGILFFGFFTQSFCMDGNFLDRETAKAVLSRKQNRTFWGIMFDYYWLKKCFFAPSKSGKNSEKISGRQRARLLTKLAKDNDEGSFMDACKKYPKNRIHASIDVGHLNTYDKFLAKQVNQLPLTKSARKILWQLGTWGSLSVGLGGASWLCLKSGFDRYETDWNSVGFGALFGLGSLWSGYHTKQRVEKHRPSSIANRKDAKRVHVVTAKKWIEKIESHKEGDGILHLD